MRGHGAAQDVGETEERTGCNRRRAASSEKRYTSMVAASHRRWRLLRGTRPCPPPTHKSAPARPRHIAEHPEAHAVSVPSRGETLPALRGTSCLTLPTVRKRLGSPSCQPAVARLTGDRPVRWREGPPPKSRPIWWPLLFSPTAEVSAAAQLPHKQHVGAEKPDPHPPHLDASRATPTTETGAKSTPTWRQSILQPENPPPLVPLPLCCGA